MTMDVVIATNQALLAASAQTLLPSPPVQASWADISAWRGVNPATQRRVAEAFDVELFSDVTSALTDGRLLAAVPQVNNAGNAVLSLVTPGTDQLTSVAHGLKTGDGPVRVTASTTMPAGLAADTDYWVIRVDNDNIQLAASFADAMAGTVVDVTSAGAGTITVVVNAATALTLKWHSMGPVGDNNDGAVSVTADVAHVERWLLSPRTVALALSGTLSAAMSVQLVPVVK